MYIKETRLFDDKIISLKEFENICLVLKQKYNNKLIFTKQNNKYYNDFKNNLIELVIFIMKNIIDNSIYKDDNISFIIKKFCFGYGCFNKYSNEIIIREDIIEKIYKGDIKQLIVIFHEIYHFIVKYDILNGIVNEDIIKIFKEKLICNNKKNYKINNYRILYEENYVEIKAISEFLYLIDMLKIELTKKDIKILKDDYNQVLESYNYNKRFIEGINIYVEFNQVFDEMIKRYPEWLNYTQIGLEYTKNNKNYVSIYSLIKYFIIIIA